MAQDTRTKFIAIVLLTAFFGYLVAYSLAPEGAVPTIGPLEKARLKKGIDLAGGAELTYRLLYPKDEPDKGKKTEAATQILKNRIDQKGLKEPKIVPRGDDQIVIQLAGVDRAALDDYRKLIEQSGKLELFASAPKDIQEQYNRDSKVPQDYMAKENDEKMSGDYAHFGGDRILLRALPVIEGRHVATAGHRQEFRPPGGMRWVVNFELTAEGGKLFDEAAARLFNETPRGLIVIVLDGKIISKPVVNAEKFEGSGIIEGRFEEQDARNLAIILRSGALPAQIGRLGQKPGERPQPEFQTFVGPSLGQDSIRRGYVASGLTLLLVAAFMLIYYRTSGFIAVLSLVLNLIYLLGIMAFFGATLTLPGIAGIVLTVGMAVDANILIFERIREEQAKGKTASQSFEAGYDRAFSAILDANVTTFMAALVLYYAGTGPVQGFAVTLSIGILTTLFSVLFCGKTFQRMQIAGGVTEFRMLKLMSDPKLDYFRWARPFVMASVVMVVGGTIFAFSRGEKNLGIDFLGGSMLQFTVGQPVPIDDVRLRLQKFAPGGVAKYPDAEVQTVAPPGSTGPVAGGGGLSTSFQVRTRYSNVEEFKNDVQELFKDVLSREPFEDMAAADVTNNPRAIANGPAGPGWYVYVKADKFDLAALRKKITEALKNPPRDLDFALAKDDEGNPAFLLEEVPDARPGLKKLKLTLAKADAEAGGGAVRLRVRDTLKRALAEDLSQDPFAAQDAIGPAVAQELKNKTFWAMIGSWFLMILYIAIRFGAGGLSGVKYGVAAVAALVHDALIAIAFTSLAGAVVPKSWGLSFEMNLTTMAAILTIIGFSINDTIVIFDRIRENLILMKKATFSEIINASVNQTMSRTILTALTVWVSVIVLYVFTMQTGGGIAEFAFPLIVGVLAGTYSTIYIASPIVYWLHKGVRPPTA